MRHNHQAWRDPRPGPPRAHHCHEAFTPIRINPDRQRPWHRHWQQLPKHEREAELRAERLQAQARRSHLYRLAPRAEHPAHRIAAGLLSLVVLAAFAPTTFATLGAPPTSPSISTMQAIAAFGALPERASPVAAGSVAATPAAQAVDAERPNGIPPQPGGPAASHHGPSQEHIPASEGHIPSPQHNASVLICHVPPGHPDGARTLSIAPAAWLAHAAHNDTLGACAGSTGGGGGNGGGSVIEGRIQDPPIPSSHHGASGGSGPPGPASAPTRPGPAAPPGPPDGFNPLSAEDGHGVHLLLPGRQDGGRQPNYDEEERVGAPGHAHGHFDHHEFGQ